MDGDTSQRKMNDKNALCKTDDISTLKVTNCDYEGLEEDC